MINFCIEIPSALDERIGALADKTGRTKSYYVCTALEEKMAEFEDYFLSLQSLESVKAKSHVSGRKRA